MANPYDHTRPITEITNYIGREGTRRWLTDALNKSVVVAVHSRHRMGTTSTLWLGLGLAKQQGYRVAYLDARELRPPFDLAAVLRRLFVLLGGQPDDFTFDTDRPGIPI